MGHKTKYGIVEKISMAVGLLAKPKDLVGEQPVEVETSGELSPYPPMNKWDNWVEFDA